YRRVLAVSARVRDEVAADYGVPRELIRVLYNGVDLERFHPARRAALGRAARRALGLADGERLCAAIGSGFARKGFDLLLRLWRPLAAVVVDDPEDLVALARALAHALGPEHDALARAARARAEDFPWDRHLDGLEALLAEVARGR